MLYRDLRLYSSANSLVGIIAEIKRGFKKIELLLVKKPDIADSQDTENDQQQPGSDIDNLFKGFVQDVGLE